MMSDAKGVSQTILLTCTFFNRRGTVRATTPIITPEDPMALDVRTFHTMTHAAASAGRASGEAIQTGARRASDWMRMSWLRASAAWSRVDDAERLRLRNHALALLASVAVTLLTLGTGVWTAGLLILADAVIFVSAFCAGFSSGAVAALTVVLVARLAAITLLGAPLGGWISLVIAAKGLLVAGIAAALALRINDDASEQLDLEERVDDLRGELRSLRSQLTATRTAAAEAHEQVSSEADLARRQLTTLQSVTDPALNGLHGTELVQTILDRLRAAIGADGVALCPMEERSRLFAAPAGLTPLGVVQRLRGDARDHASRRTNLVHNDAARVAETSLCGWPGDVTSLIAVPVVQAGRLRLVVEVANRRGRLSTEWELALIQVVAERAAGWIRQGPIFDTGAVA